ncbi:transcription factor IIIA-like isoform X2 [Cimex lectularius]|nr:transcription factor IIIA-like isoform X2 [Cimex lectularius]XP_014248547.1 transcription factor IIIA-like isoform X2 [Cimex lectularius]XP_014248549.1 transcription factor IIIA-like isoform X2 [Cimex lectularius]XP_014248550.1 transcription factor IIIA-like isoform X2 [Cimex lectularius]
MSLESSEEADARPEIPPSPDTGQKEEQKNVESKNRKHLTCDVKGCTASFSRPWRLAAHKAVHLGEKPFPCDVAGCDKAYTSSYHLRRHKLSTHSSSPAIEKVFKCEFEGCTAIFKQRQNERRHYRRTHEKKICLTCGKSFEKQSMLRSHAFYHTGEPPYKCEICKAGFLTKGNLIRHNRGHREHICPVHGCIQVFDTWSHLRKHLATHPLQFTCYYCKKAYRLKEFLKAHIKKHMNANGGPLKRQCTLKRYTCSICSASLLGKASLKRHISLIHEKSKNEKTEKADNKPRAPRKDKGVPKRSMATALSSVFLNADLELRLLHGEPVVDDLERAISTNQIQESQMVLVDGSTSESDVPIVKEIEFNKL